MAEKIIKSDLVDYQCLYVDGHQTTDLYLSYCGIEYCPKDHSYGPLSRNEFLIHFIFDGKGYFQIYDKEYHLSSNQAFLIPPNVPTYYYANSTSPYSYAWVGFDGSKAKDYLSQTDLSLEHPVCDLNIPANNFKILIQEILDAKELTLPNELQRVGLLYEILSHLIDSCQSSIVGKKPLNYSSGTYVEYALQYIEHHYNHICVKDIAEYVGINRSYLHSIFKKKLQMSPQEYLISYRLNIAKKLLEETELSMMDTAVQVGYHDPLTFSKAFKKRYSFPPTEYRKQLQKRRNHLEQTNDL